MAEFTLVPFATLLQITTKARQEKIDMYVKKAYQRILKQAHRGEYEHKMWMTPDENGQLEEESVECLRRVKELFPGISLTQETTPSNEIVCTFSWRTKNISTKQPDTTAAEGDSIVDILQGQRDVAASLASASSLLATLQQPS